MTELGKERLSVEIHELGKTEVQVSTSKDDIADIKATVDAICKSKVKSSEKTATTVELPKGLLKEVCEKLNTKSPSDAVLLALAGFLSMQNDKHAKYISDVTEELRLKYPFYEDRHTMIQVTLRMELFFYNRITDIHDGKFNEIVKYAILNFLKNFNPKAKLTRPIKLPGTKWGSPMKNAISQILDGRYYDTQFEPCMGALGIFANHDVADNAVLCDLDEKKVNFFTQLRDNLDPFLQKFACMAHTKDEYQQMEKILSESNDNFQKALFFYYKNFHSDSFCNPNYTKRDFTLADFTNLLLISQRLQGVKLDTKHILKSLPKYSKPNTIVLCDPPYIDTHTYKVPELSDAEHQMIAQTLLASKSDFLYFCRTTARGNNKVKKEQHTNACLDDFFCEKGLFFLDIDINAKDDIITERIITNFKFDGCTPYTKEVAYNG